MRGQFTQADTVMGRRQQCDPGRGLPRTYKVGRFQGHESAGWVSTAPRDELGLRMVNEALGQELGL